METVIMLCFPTFISASFNKVSYCNIGLKLYVEELLGKCAFGPYQK